MTKNKKNRKREQTMQSSQFDPQGMYTGVPKNKNERPVQDADDL